MCRSSSTSSRWFDRRRGSAVALISCGQYIAGILWPPLIALGIEHLGWRPTMLAFGVASGVCMVLSVLIFLRPVPDSFAPSMKGTLTARPRSERRPEWCSRSCALPVSLLRTDGDAAGPFGCLLQRSRHRPSGALMLSILLGSALVSRLFWGWLSDHVGGLYTILAASMCQAAALAGFILTQDEAGLFAVSAAFGAGFSGIIPAYVVVLRQIFPAGEASWRVPVWFFANICGMALGGWLAGAMYDQLGSYAPAFVAGVAFNVANIALIGWLAMRAPMTATR